MGLIIIGLAMHSHTGDYNIAGGIPLEKGPRLLIAAAAVFHDGMCSRF